MPTLPRTSALSRSVPVEALTPQAFEGFGEVVQNPRTHAGQPSSLQKTEANQGSAEKWLDVTQMRNWYHLSSSAKAAEVKMNMFVCKPRQLSDGEGGRKTFAVKILERHPFTPQTFIPMGLGQEDSTTSYLVIVAPTLPLSPGEPRPKGPGLPDLSNLKAFIARGDQAVTYGPGTWHAPMVVLGERPIDFVVVQYMNGIGIEDCQEVEVETSDGGQGLNVQVGEVVTDEGMASETPKAKL
ncbi:hypothetical protein D0861_07921 [Hortaea werneckii]|uniref:Ureidoglycolate hydrolase n=1 Tax=Hortaea werneckii TaxID=91943 RepID=A0A3M7F0H2_HORWE|nr:hypothetical protein D0861_07921 [Hortaea werneckii]